MEGDNVYALFAMNAPIIRMGYFIANRGRGLVIEVCYLAKWSIFCDKFTYMSNQSKQNNKQGALLPSTPKEMSGLISIEIKSGFFFHSFYV